MDASDLEISIEDIRAALKELKTYVDVTDEDLREIYRLALTQARKRLAGDVPVRDVMTTEVISVSRDTGLREIAEILASNRIAGLPVVDDDKRVVGVISETDVLTCRACPKVESMEEGDRRVFKNLLRRLIGERSMAKQCGNQAGDIMTQPPVTIRPETSIGKAAAIMEEKRIRRLPVVDDDGRLVGIVSLIDMVGAIRR